MTAACVVVAETLLSSSSPQAQVNSSVAASEDSGISALREQIVAAVRVVESGLVERETEVRLLLLAAICGEHLLLLGPPGTAKSELVRLAQQTAVVTPCQAHKQRDRAVA